MIVSSIDNVKVVLEKNALFVLQQHFTIFHVQLHRYYIYLYILLFYAMEGKQLLVKGI